MAREPTYEELVLRINELENQTKACKKVEEDLLREKDFSDSVITSLPGIFYVFDEEGRFLRWNEHFEKMTELSPEELSKTSALELIAEEDKEAAADAIQKVFVEGKSYVEANFVSKSGKKTPYYLAGLRTRIGNCMYLVGMGIDNTVRKRAEEVLRKDHEELELRVQQRTAELVRANELLQFEIEERKRLEKALMHKEKLKTLGAIAAEVAHEIRNPLVSIGGFAQRLKQKFADLPECDIILSESQRLEKILLRIRNYLEPVEIHPQECCINTIITDCVKLLSPETERRRIMCQLELDSRLSPGYVDPEILTEIFINLIRNATEAIEKEGILMVKSYENDKELHIEFKNKTTSLKVKHPEALFMPFAEGGDSFGLPLCYRLIKDMGGLLSFKSEDDFMIFTVSLRKKVQLDPYESNAKTR